MPRNPNSIQIGYTGGHGSKEWNHIMRHYKISPQMMPLVNWPAPIPVNPPYNSGPGPSYAPNTGAATQGGGLPQLEGGSIATSVGAYGSQFSGLPGFSGIGQSIAGGQAPGVGQIAGAIGGLATGIAGLGVTAVGLIAGLIGFSPSVDPHGIAGIELGEVGKSDLGGDMSGIGGDKGDPQGANYGGDISAGGDMASSAGTDGFGGTGFGGADFGGANFGGADFGGGIY